MMIKNEGDKKYEEKPDCRCENKEVPAVPVMGLHHENQDSNQDIKEAYSVSEPAPHKSTLEF